MSRTSPLSIRPSFPAKVFWAWLFLLLAVRISCPALAQEASSDPVLQSRKLSAALSSMKEKIEKEERRLASLRQEQASIKKERRRIIGELKRTADDKAEAAERISKLEEERGKAESETALARGEMELAQSELDERLAAIYKMYKRTSALDYLMNSSSATDVLKRAHYLGKIAARDRQKLERFRLAFKQFEAHEKTLERLKQDKLAQIERAAKLEAELKNKDLKQAELLRESKQRQEAIEGSLAKLRKAAEGTELVLSRLMGGEDAAEQVEPQETPSAAASPTPGVQPSPKETPIQTAMAVKPTTEIKLRGLESLRGRLPIPVNGEVVRRFGKTRHQKFSDMVFIKGLEFRADVGERVRAVAPGKVVFSQVMPGFGNVLILDHGMRFYTLYGRLALTHRGVGEVINTGDVLAVTGQPDNLGRNFYFELRRHGKAIDPTGYFGDKPRFVTG